MALVEASDTREEPGFADSSSISRLCSLWGWGGGALPHVLTSLSPGGRGKAMGNRSSHSIVRGTSGKWVMHLLLGSFIDLTRRGWAPQVTLGTG